MKRKTINRAVENPKLFHRFKLSVEEQLIRLMNSKGRVAEGDEKICEELNDTFRSVFCSEEDYSSATNEMVWGGELRKHSYC